jgi:hypothetical protein
VNGQGAELLVGYLLFIIVVQDLVTRGFGIFGVVVNELCRQRERERLSCGIF